MRQVLLQSNSNLRVQDRSRGTVIVCIWDVLSVDRGRYGEEVGVRIIVVCLVEVESIASEDDFRDKSVSAADVVSIAHSLAAVEDRRIQGLCDVFEYGWLCCWERGFDLVRERGVVLDEW